MKTTFTSPVQIGTKVGLAPSLLAFLVKHNVGLEYVLTTNSAVLKKDSHSVTMMLGSDTMSEVMAPAAPAALKATVLTAFEAATKELKAKVEAELVYPTPEDFKPTVLTQTEEEEPSWVKAEKAAAAFVSNATPSSLPKVLLKDSTDLLQPVAGTDPGSTYYVIAWGP